MYSESFKVTPLLTSKSKSISASWGTWGSWKEKIFPSLFECMRFDCFHWFVIIGTVKVHSVESLSSRVKSSIQSPGNELGWDLPAFIFEAIMWSGLCQHHRSPKMLKMGRPPKLQLLTKHCGYLLFKLLFVIIIIIRFLSKSKSTSKSPPLIPHLKVKA